MTAPPRTITLGMVLPAFAGKLRVLVGSDDDMNRPVHGSTLLTEQPLTADPGIAVICTDVRSREDLDRLVEQAGGGPDRLLILTTPSPVPAGTLRQRLTGHIVLGPSADVEPTSVIVSIARAAETPEDPVTRRLASLQRSLTQALGEPEPVVALLTRLKNTCNASAAVVDKRGHAIHSTGPVPLSLLFGEISQTAADTQMIDIDGWHGVADRLTDPDESGDHLGWLIVTARRADFPDAYAVSAVHVGAALVEASQRMALVARKQERAVRAAVLEEALALKRTPDDARLAARITSLGVDFSQDLRTLVARPATPPRAPRRRVTSKALASSLSRALDSWDVGHLVSVREQFVVVLAQASASTLARALVASESLLPNTHVGVGRPVRTVGGVADSYHDAQLAIQTLRRTGGERSMMTYEDFDFATRLFSDVGIDRMVAWANEFLAPIDGRVSLLEGLEEYFAHKQNMNAAADVLNIHHNSLRYRLAKIEELLEIDLRDPAAVSSLFLALAARELGRAEGAVEVRTGRATATTAAAEVEAARLPADFARRAEPRGVVRDAGR